MKTYHTIFMLLMCSTIASAQLHVEPAAGLSTRLRIIASASITQRLHAVELSAIASNEFGHGFNAAGSFGLHFPTSSNEGDAIILYSGYGYSWHTEKAQSELTNKPYFLAGVKYLDGWGLWELRYNSNTIQFIIGGRIFNRRK